MQEAYRSFGGIASAAVTRSRRGLCSFVAPVWRLVKRSPVFSGCGFGEPSTGLETGATNEHGHRRSRRTRKCRISRTGTGVLRRG